jgi:predicted XRE-type DNA-binding protein
MRTSTFVKAQLVFKIDTLMKERGLKQVEAADLFGIRQPDVSKMLRGEFRWAFAEHTHSGALPLKTAPPRYNSF